MSVSDNASGKCPVCLWHLWCLCRDIKDAKDVKTSHLCKGRYMSPKDAGCLWKMTFVFQRCVYVFVKCIFHIFALPNISQTMKIFNWFLTNIYIYIWNRFYWLDIRCAKTTQPCSPYNMVTLVQELCTSAPRNAENQLSLSLYRIMFYRKYLGPMRMAVAVPLS